MDIVLLGDQLAECQHLLKQVVTIKDNIILNSLLDRVAAAVHEEIARDPHQTYSKQIPRFSTTKEIIEWYYKEGQPNPALESAFLCLAQLSHFVCYFEERHESYLPAQSTITGACTGLLAASAIASANSLTTLLPLAVEAVRIAFRTGLYVGDVADRLEGERNAGQNWSTIVATSDKAEAETAIDEFNNAHAFALSSKLWISAYAPSSVTISGPPSKRRRLFSKSDFYSKSKHRDIKIHAPYHASHLHSSSIASKVIDDQTLEIFGNAELHFPVVSSATAQPIKASSTVQLLKECLNEVLRQPLRWDLLVKEFTSGSFAPADGKFRIRAFGPSELADHLSSALKSNGDIEISKEDYNTWSSTRRQHTSTMPKHLSSDIAIVGMSGRFPDAADHEKFWELLEKGLDVHREVPSDRYPVESHTDLTSKKKNTSHTPYGNFIENPGLFDARFFNMSPREANQTDPMQRLELVTAYEAMEMAGIVPGRTPSTKADRIGTFYGMTSDDWREINAAQNIDTYFISGGVRAFGAGRINYYMKFSGPSFIVDTACSSSFAALQLACTSLRAGECDTAFSGGANVLTNPDIFSGLSRGHFLSQTGNCKTFDNDADGYCRGDGVASVILKRMEDALRDKDPILGVIKGTATNHSAEAVSITHPHVGAQQFLFDKVLRDSNVDCRDVSYVEMHGTGTQAGDAVEMESVSSIFAPTDNRRSREQPLWLGSVKSNIGHGEAVSGVCALIKVLLMLQRNAIPPHCGIKGVMNKKFDWPDLQARGVNIALKKTPFPRPAGGKRTVFINNFSAAGGNTAVLLEDAPEKSAIVSQDPRPVHVVNVSAKSLASFKKNVKLLRAFINDNSSVDLASLAYTSTARRIHYTYRASYAISNTSDLSTKLASLEEAGTSPIPPEAPQVAFAFTGQGSLYAHLGRQLFEHSRRFRSVLEHFDKLAQAQGFPSFLVLVNTDSAHEDLNTLSPVITQVGMSCVQMALVDLWTSWGLEPKAVIGHSLGEYAALYAAGVLCAADAIFLVGTRASRMEEECTKDTHAMLAIKSSAPSIQESLDGTNVEIACVNSDDETVVAGSLADVQTVSDRLRGRSIEFKKLNVTYAFHSSQMDPALESFQEAATAVTFNAPRLPVLSPLLQSVVRDQGAFSASYLANHCRERVDFKGALAAGISEGILDEKTLWLEIGAHPICTRFVKAALGSAVSAFPALKRGEDPWKTIATSLSGLYLAGANPSWSAYHQDYESSLECLSLPTYSFDNKVHWLQYVNDWTLTKGDPVQKAAPTALPAPSKLSTTSIHRIVQEDIKKDKATVVAESDIADPLLHKAIAGHSVNGVGLGPSSLWADMALTLTDYAYKQLQPGAKLQDMNVHHMENPASLLVRNLKDPQHQLVTIKSVVDLSRQQATVTVTSKPNGKTDTVHAKCLVDFEDSSRWSTEWARSSFLVRSRLDLLNDRLKKGDATLLPRGLVYRLFGSLVDYSDTYRGMKEVVVDGPNYEATATIDLQATSKDGKFTMAPYTIDSIGHLAGFIMNGSWGHDAKNQVFISHGWESMRLPYTLEPGKQYHSWVKMQSDDGEKTFAGDVYLFDDSKKIIGLIEGLKFQAIPRRVLDTFIPPAGKAAAAPPKPAPQASAPPKQSQPLPPKIVVPPTPKKKQVVIQSPKVAKAAPASTDNIVQALSIIATEVGVDVAELADPIPLTDLGVDSLMTLTIAGRLREELELEIDNDAMAEMPTIGDLKKYLSSQSGPTLDDDDDSSDESTSDSDSGMLTGVTTPDTSSERPKDSDTSEPSQPSASEAEDIIGVIRNTIAEQMDVDINEITDNVDLSTIGMDSLMALTVLSTLRETTGKEFQPELFADNTTLLALRKALTPAAAPPPVKAKEPSKPTKPTSTEPMKLPTKKVQASCVLLQGNVRTATRKLWLLPDGSGSPTSYSSIPPIAASDLTVYGLTCPFLKEPHTFTCGVIGVTTLYIEEIIRRQPEGPYLIGGWSAGGVFAFEATRQLAALQKMNPNKNYQVEKLLLLDSPCPYALEPLPTRLHVFFNEIGLLGDGNPANTPKWLLPHFQASIDALKAYEPVLIKDDPYEAPSTFLVWCKDGVCKYPDDPRPPPQDDDPKSMKWLLNNRTDFGPNGWDQLVGEGNCTCVTLEGNHFTMMHEPIATVLRDRMREGLKDVL